MSSADPCSSKKRPREEAEDVLDEVMEEADSLKKAREEEEEDVKEYDASEDLFESQEKEVRSDHSVHHIALILLLFPLLS